MMLSQPCKRCWLQSCICHALEPVHTNLEFVVIRHWKESKKSSNSARIADICLPNLRVVEYPNEIDEITDIDPLTDAVLYPPKDQYPIMKAPPKRLFVLDGSWKQARKMRNRIKVIKPLPSIALYPSSSPPPRISANLRNAELE